VECFGYQDVNALRTSLHRFPDEPAVKEAFYGESLVKVERALIREYVDIRFEVYFRILYIRI
jgi:hypothetical protein